MLLQVSEEVWKCNNGFIGDTSLPQPAWPALEILSIKPNKEQKGLWKDQILLQALFGADESCLTFCWLPNVRSAAVSETFSCWKCKNFRNFKVQSAHGSMLILPSSAGLWCFITDNTKRITKIKCWWFFSSSLMLGSCWIYFLSLNLFIHVFWNYFLYLQFKQYKIEFCIFSLLKKKPNNQNKAYDDAEAVIKGENPKIWNRKVSKHPKLDSNTVRFVCRSIPLPLGHSIQIQNLISSSTCCSSDVRKLSQSIP